MKKYLILYLLIMVGFTGIAQSGVSDRMSKNTQNVEVKIFPNPATNVVNILGLNNTSKADIVILDIYGNTVIKHQWAVRRNALNIPISELASGTYVIHIRTGENMVQTKFHKK